MADGSTSMFVMDAEGRQITALEIEVGRDLNAQTGNLSPLVASGLFYLALTVPLTHLVNYIDRRLSKGRPAEPELTAATEEIA